MLRQLKTSSSQHNRLRGGEADDGGVEETKTEKKKYVPPAFRTFVLVRREGDVWIPLRQYSAQSPRNVALKAKVPSGSIVSVQDPVDGKVHEYRTLIETIPEIERTQVQRERNISSRKKVYKQGMYSCPPCGEGFRLERKKSTPTPRRREAVTVEASAQTDDSDSADDDSSSSSAESDLSSLTSSASAADDDMATEIAVENFIKQRRQRQRDRREVRDRIDEAEEAGFFEIDNEPGKKRKQRN